MRQRTIHPTPCANEVCASHAQPDHFLCPACWRRLPFTLARDIARARVAGATDRLQALRETATAHLRDSTRSYARIAALLGEREPGAPS